MKIKVWFRANDPDPNLQFKYLIKAVSKRNISKLGYNHIIHNRNN